MPQLRKLTPAEVQTLEYKPTGQRKLIEEQYDAILSDYAVGEYGEAALDPDENRLTVRNRLRAAAVRRGLGIDFRRTNGDLIRFQIVDNADGTGAPAAVPEVIVTEVVAAVVASDLPPKAAKPRGRPKKGIAILNKP
jgi:hypothetical protein